MGIKLIGSAFALVALTVALGSLEWVAPANPEQPLFRRRGIRVDLCYWFFTPLVTRAVTRLAIGLVLFAAAIVIGHGATPPGLLAGFGPLSRLPLWGQILVGLTVVDFFGYWVHRLFHGPLWRIHIVHHSPPVLDWLAAARVHPLNELIARPLSLLPALALGVSPVALAPILPALTFYALFLHANVSWDFGPLRRVIASPRFHRWHHSSEPGAQGENLSGFLPVWDILFGTWHMPRDRVPHRPGTSEPVPQSFLGQLAYPFRRRFGPAR